VRLFSFGGYGLALAALALVVFGAIECPTKIQHRKNHHEKAKNGCQKRKRKSTNNVESHFKK